jgi:hypothetical protein
MNVATIIASVIATSEAIVVNAVQVLNVSGTVRPR